MQMPQARALEPLMGSPVRSAQRQGERQARLRFRSGVRPGPSDWATPTSPARAACWAATFAAEPIGIPAVAVLMATSSAWRR